MELSFAQLVSPTGCYATRAGRSYIQHDHQSYVAYHVHQVDVARLSVIRSAILATRLDRTLRAKVECFLYRALSHEQWKRVTSRGLDRTVRQYVETIRANAEQRVNAISSLLKSHEQEF